MTVIRFSSPAISHTLRRHFPKIIPQHSEGDGKPCTRSVRSVYDFSTSVILNLVTAARFSVKGMGDPCTTETWPKVEKGYGTCDYRGFLAFLTASGVSSSYFCRLYSRRTTTTRRKRFKTGNCHALVKPGHNRSLGSSETLF